MFEDGFVISECRKEGQCHLLATFTSSFAFRARLVGKCTVIHVANQLTSSQHLRMCCPSIEEAINRGREDVVLHFIFSFFLQ